MRGHRSRESAVRVRGPLIGVFLSLVYQMVLGLFLVPVTRPCASGILKAGRVWRVGSSPATWCDIVNWWKKQKPSSFSFFPLAIRLVPFLSLSWCQVTCLRAFPGSSSAGHCVVAQGSEDLCVRLWDARVGQGSGFLRSVGQLAPYVYFPVRFLAFFFLWRHSDQFMVDAHWVVPRHEWGWGGMDSLAWTFMGMGSGW